MGSFKDRQYHKVNKLNNEDDDKSSAITISKTLTNNIELNQITNCIKIMSDETYKYKTKTRLLNLKLDFIILEIKTSVQS